jgi:SAM-dependent methyltransferase
VLPHVTKADYWNGVADSWDGRRDRLWRAHSDALNIALCRRWLSDRPARRLLKTDLFDEAAGVGLWPQLLGLARHVDAIDISHTVARHARRRHPIAAVTADVRHLPFPDCAFDTVVSNSTLDHFDDPGAISDGLRELHRVLDRDGRLLLTLDNGANPAVAIRNALPQGFLSTIGLIPYRMGRTLLPRAASDLLTKVGFAILERTAIVHSPRVAIIPLLRLLDRRPANHDGSGRWLHAIERFEIAERWPTRFLTGHFVALLAIKSRP